MSKKDAVEFCPLCKSYYSSKSNHVCGCAVPPGYDPKWDYMSNKPCTVSNEEYSQKLQAAQAALAKDLQGYGGPGDVIASAQGKAAPSMHTFSSGAKRSKKMPLYHITDLGPVERAIAGRAEIGLKYSRDNWKTGDASFVVDVLNHVREHLNSLQAGDISEDHAGAIAWGMMVWCWYRENRHQLLNEALLERYEEETLASLLHLNVLPPAVEQARNEVAKETCNRLQQPGDSACGE